MMLSLGLAPVIDLCKKKLTVGGRSSNILKSDSSSAAIFRDIPEEILIEILVRLPADSLMRFKCVSRHWSSLISSPYFTNLFFKFSSSTRHGVFMTVDECHGHSDFMLFSSSLSNMDTTTSFFQLNHGLTVSGIKNPVHFVSALRGLMCFREEREIRIINLTTRQVLNLPLIKSNLFLENYFDMWNHFGYDPVNDQYKVLTTIWSFVPSGKERRLRYETQVLVLGAGALWRNTRSHTSPPPPHRPYDQGISINGILYYGAITRCPEKKHALMSFDWNCEEFNLIELPIEAGVNWYLHGANLIKYQGQVAVSDFSHLNTESILNLWVFEDAGKIKWSHKIFVLPCQQLRHSLDVDSILIGDTSCSGEIILSGRFLNVTKKTSHAIYDLEKNRVTRRVVIEPLIYHKFFRFQYLRMTLWDDIENIMYMEA